MSYRQARNKSHAPARPRLRPAARWLCGDGPRDPRSPQPAADPGWVSPRPGGAGLVLGHRTQCWRGAGAAAVPAVAVGVLAGPAARLGAGSAAGSWGGSEDGPTSRGVLVAGPKIRLFFKHKVAGTTQGRH